MEHTLEIKWTVSRGRDTYGYNICTLYVDGRKAARCNGGGYDMEGTVLGDYVAKEYASKLLTLKKEFYGLTYHNPNHKPGKAVINGETIEERERRGESLGLERYQEFYAASSKTPSKVHIVPLIAGACGKSSVEHIMNAIGLELEYVPVRSKKLTVYRLKDKKEV